MTRYLCKCGAVKRKSTNADNTGNRDTENCQGCPYLLPWGTQEHIKGEGYSLKIKGYECRMSQELQYNSCFIGKTTDKCTCSVVSLDYEFLEQISDWIRETYPGGELSGGFSREDIRATDFSNNGRYRYAICCSLNRAGMAAKAALKERFFKPNGDRKDLTPAQETHKILTGIENGKKASRMSTKQDQVPAENEVWISPAGVKYRIGQITVGKKPHWHTERMEDGEWKPGNSSFYAEFENAQGEFGAWIRRESLVPEEAGMREPLSTPSEGALAAVPDAQLAEPMEHTPIPAFDTTGLDRQTVIDLELAEREYRNGRRMAETGLRRMADGVAIAHDALCGPYATIGRSGDGASGVVANCDDSKHGNRGEDTFRAWCESMGISKDTAYRLLQVSALFEQSSPRQQKVLEELSPSLLYAAARPSAPTELVEQVKSGDITTHKQYQELLAELKARDDTIQEKDAALRKARQDADLAQTTANIYEAQKKGAEEQCLALIDENEAQAARIKELESRPIETTAATEEEIARWREEGANSEAEAHAGAYKTVCAERDKAAAAAEKAQEEAERLRKTLEGRTAYLDSVEAELKATKTRLADAESKTLKAMLAASPSPPAQTPPTLILCKQCRYEPICCGIQFLSEEDTGEEMYAGFAGLDEDAINARLVGCTAGRARKEDPQK